MNESDIYVDNSHGFFHTSSRYLISISSTVGYEALYAITRLKTSMESILDYVEYPLPAICYQAVKVTSWFYLFSAALSAQNWCPEVEKEDQWCNTSEPENDSYWWFFKVYE